MSVSDNSLLAPKDFDELADWLVRVSSAFSPAELHGAIVGGLSGSMRLSQKNWSLFGLAVIGAGEHLHPEDQHNSGAVLGGLAQEQLDLLAGNEMTFVPYLPDDDCEMEQRTEAVSYWCKGFLGGFAEAQVKAQRRGDVDGDDPLPENVVEALRDIAAIAQATLDAEDEYSDEFGDDPLAIDDIVSKDSRLADDDEIQNDHERDYVEIVEYLRLAALTVFTEYGWVEVIPPVTSESGSEPRVEDDGHTLH